MCQESLGTNKGRNWEFILVSGYRMSGTIGGGFSVRGGSLPTPYHSLRGPTGGYVVDVHCRGLGRDWRREVSDEISRIVIVESIKWKGLSTMF